MNKAQRHALLMLLGLTFLVPQAKGSAMSEEEKKALQLKRMLEAEKVAQEVPSKLEHLTQSADSSAAAAAKLTTGTNFAFSSSEEPNKDKCELPASRKRNFYTPTAGQKEHRTSNKKINSSSSSFCDTAPHVMTVATAFILLSDTSVHIDKRADIAANILGQEGLAAYHNAVAPVAIDFLSDTSVHIDKRADIACGILSLNLLGAYHVMTAATSVTLLSDTSVFVYKRVDIAANILGRSALAAYHDAVAPVAIDLLSDTSIDVDERVDIAFKILDRGALASYRERVVQRGVAWLSDTSIDVGERVNIAFEILDRGVIAAYHDTVAALVIDLLREFDDDYNVEFDYNSNLDQTLEIILDQNTFAKHHGKLVAMLKDTTVSINKRAVIACKILGRSALAAYHDEVATITIIDLLSGYNGECYWEFLDHVLDCDVLAGPHYGKLLVTAMSNGKDDVGSRAAIADYILRRDALAGHHDTIALALIDLLKSDSCDLHDIIEIILDQKTFAKHHGKLVTMLKDTTVHVKKRAAITAEILKQKDYAQYSAAIDLLEELDHDDLDDILGPILDQDIFARCLVPDCDGLV